MILIGDGGLALQIQDVIDSFNTYSISTGGRVEYSDAVLIAFASLKDISKREEAYNLYKDQIGTLISPKATVSQDAYIEKGCVILHNAFIGPESYLKENVLIGTGAIVEHGSFISAHSVILTGAIINGDCHIGQRCMIGSGAVIIHGISICDDVKIGAGTVVIKDIAEPGTYVGNPARRVK